MGLNFLKFGFKLFKISMGLNFLKFGFKLFKISMNLNFLKFHLYIVCYMRVTTRDLQVAGCRLQVAGCRLQVAGCEVNLKIYQFLNQHTHQVHF